MHSCVISLRIAFVAIMTMTFSMSASVNAPVTISIAGVEEPGLREQIITELIQQYDCCILSRSRAYSLYAEQTMDNLAAMERLTKKLGAPQAADFVVVIRTGSAGLKGETAGEITCLDLRSINNVSAVKIIKFLEPSSNQVRTAITKTIVSALDLKPSASINATTEKNNATVVAVLPFVDCDEFRTLRRTSGNQIIGGLNLEVELAIQGAGLSRIKLVDHNALNKVLTELKLQNMQFANPSSASAIARLMAANRIILGTVSTVDGRLRIDMQIVDAGTTAIIAANYGYAASSEDLRNIARKISIDLIKSHAKLPRTYSSSEMQRKAEATCIIKHEEKYGIFPNQLLQLLSDSEVAFSMDPNTLSTRYSVLTNLCRVVGVNNNMSKYKSAKAREMMPLKQRAGELIEEILKQEKGPIPFTVQWPLVVRSEIQTSIGNHDYALQLIQEHLRQYPDKEPCRSFVIMAEAQYGKGDLSSATQTLGRIKNMPGKSGAMRNLYDAYETPRIESLSAAIESGYEKPITTGISKEQFLAIQSKVEKTKDHVLLPDWDAYLSNLLKFKQPNEALADLESTDKKAVFSRCGDEHACITFTAMAKCLLNLNKKEDAVRNCKTALRLTPAKISYPPTKKWLSEASNIVITTESEIGKIPELWKTLAETRQTPVNRKIYLLPVGNYDKTLLLGESRKIGDFLKTEVVILPSITLSEQLMQQRKLERDPASLSTQSKTLCHMADALWTDISNKAAIPADALFVAFITSESFKDKLFPNKPFSRSNGNPVLLPTDKTALGTILSLHYTYAQKNDQKQAIAYITTGLLNAKLCQYPCLFSIRPDYFAVKTGVFGICPACQEEYKKVDFDKIHNDLMDYLKKAGAKIVKPSEVKFTELELPQQKPQ